MYHNLSRADFQRVLAEKRVKDAKFLEIYVHATGALFEFWLAEVGPAKAAILGFVLSRTLFYSKEAEQIWSYQFIDGIEKREGGLVCRGVGLKDRAFRDHLGQLVEDGFLDVYKCVDSKGNELSARIFEININKILEPMYENRGGSVPIPQPKKPRTTRSEPILGRQNLPQGVARNAPHKICINNRLDKSNHSALRSEDGAKVLALPKRQRVSPTQERSERVEDVVSAVAHRHEQARAVRASAAQTKAPWLLSKEEMQAVIDRAMLAYLPDEPRMIVTNKEYGFFKKRLKESAPKSFTEFMDWVIRYWHSIAKQNRNAARKRGLNGAEEKSEPLALTPSFSQLVYRLPYFLKAYSNFLAERRSDANDEAEEKHRKRLEARTAEAERQAAELRNRLRERNAAKPVTATRIARTAAPKPQPVRQVDVDDAINAELNFGEWRGPQSTRGSKYAKR